jgi:hypothetical protein
MQYAPQDWVISEVMNGKVVCNIGQIDKTTTRALEKLVRAGTLIKWRGKWFPAAGEPFGLGSDKTCWGLASEYGALASKTIRLGRGRIER